VRKSASCNAGKTGNFAESLESFADLLPFEKETIMLKKFTATVLCLALIFSCLTGCGHSKNVSSGTDTNKDDFPVTVNNITINNKPTGVAVLSPNVADVILALGYELCLKARSTKCTQNDLAALPVVTADDAYKIKNDGADLVFADSDITQKQRDTMRNAGITVLTISKASSRADMARLYAQVGATIKGKVTGSEKGKTVATGIFESIDDVTRAVPFSSVPATAVYLYDLIGDAATGDTIAGSLVTASGFHNIADDGSNGKYSVDNMLKANPKYIFCIKGLKAQLMSSQQFSKLDAVEQKKVYEMDPSLMTLQGEQMINAVTFMAGTAYPQLLQSTSSSLASPSKPDSSGTPSSTVSTDGLNLDQTLRNGMQNNDVLKMQNRLLKLGYMFVKPSGLFAEGTEQAVKDFQLENGLPATGIADPTTLHKMFDSNAKRREN
jgi:ABC-type Fe3+-hydroxamate transport system substrate-binding protein